MRWGASASQSGKTLRRLLASDSICHGIPPAEAAQSGRDVRPTHESSMSTPSAGRAQSAAGSGPASSARERSKCRSAVKALQWSESAPRMPGRSPPNWTETIRPRSHHTPTMRSTHGSAAASPGRSACDHGRSAEISREATSSTSKAESTLENAARSDGIMGPVPQSVSHSSDVAFGPEDEDEGDDGEGDGEGDGDGAAAPVDEEEEEGSAPPVLLLLLLLESPPPLRSTPVDEESLMPVLELELELQVVFVFVPVLELAAAAAAAASRMAMIFLRLRSRYSLMRAPSSLAM